MFIFTLLQVSTKVGWYPVSLRGRELYSKVSDRYLREIRPYVQSDYFFANKKTGRLSRQWTNVKIKEGVEKLVRGRNLPRTN